MILQNKNRKKEEQNFGENLGFKQKIGINHNIVRRCVARYAPTIRGH
jgi:hypothetical protein